MIIVCSLRAAQDQVILHKPSRAISILAPPTEHPVFDDPNGDNHLCLTFHDVAAVTPGLSAPTGSDMEKLLTFIKTWDTAKPMLIHCWAGISRSTASAYIATCMLNQDKDEEELAWALRDASPSATPNPMLIKLADDALGRKGRMIRAIQDIGRGEDAFEGEPFRLDV
jgi:predicted protein tyrosine phosphatase